MKQRFLHPSNKRRRIVCLGMATLDQIFRVDTIPEAPAKFRALDFIVTGGGQAANAAVTVRRLGGAAQYWGRVGDDPTGDQILRQLSDERVDIQHVHRLHGARSKTSAILIDSRGERLVCSAPSQGYPPDTSWLPLDEIEVMHAVLADSRWKPGAMTLFDAAAEYKLPSVFDADGGEAEDLLALSRAATHPGWSEPMLKSLGFGTPEQALTKAFGGRNKICAVTLGERGVLWFDGKRIQTMPSLPVKSVDTLAAGDTWHGALAYALADGHNDADAIEFASLVAGIKCSTFGGRVGIPTRAQVDAFKP
ncbi:MAG: PfkB family carbohydrate kinase [Casimicrobium sp.]